MISAEPLVLRGVHHTAFPTWKPKSTVEFYRDALGLTVRHAITAKGWGRKHEQHPDFLHFFFDTGDDNMLAFFYYIGTQPHPALAELRGYLALSRHTAWAARDVAELRRWRDRIAAAGVRVSEAIEHEILHSIYFRDPNGYDMEITTQIRALDERDTRDAESSVQAMIDVFGDDNVGGATIEDFWRRKGTNASGCAISLLRVPEFEPLVRALANVSGVSIATRGDYAIAETGSDLVLERAACGVGHAVWFGALTGGIAGRIVEFSADTLRLAPLTSPE